MNNPIYIGFAWSQAVTLGPDVAASDAAMRMTFIKIGSTSSATLPITLRKDSPTEFVIEMTKEQTGTLSPGTVGADLIAIESGVERPLGVRILVEVIRVLADSGG